MRCTFARSTRVAFALLLAGAAAFTTNPARADVPISVRTMWSGSMDFFATGASMAIDGPDADTNVDTLAQPATVSVPASKIPAGSTLVQAFLYWSGTIPNADCLPPGKFDADVAFTPPGASQSTMVVADTCYCSDAGASSYDVQVCRADVTALLGASGAPLIGDYTVDGFDASIGNGATDNASFSIVLVFKHPSLPPRDIALYDGVETLSSSTVSFSLSGLNVDTPAQGDLTWYTIEGDIGGGSPGAEQVVVTGVPGGGSLILQDADNPANNPMNRTINTTEPPQTGTIGVDIDRFDISAALTPGDTAVDMLYSANTDKWWIAYNIVGINVFEPVFGVKSKKTGVLLADADGNGVPSAGDTVRYTIHVENTGTDAGVVDVNDPIAPEIASFALVSAGGGTDASTPNELVVQAIPVAVGGSSDVVFDAVIGVVPDGTVLSNVATFDATPDGDSGDLAAEDFVVRRDSDEDGFFDNDDNCPLIFNNVQEDADGDGLGDVCDACPFDAMNDADADGVCGDVDNCPGVANPMQENADADGLGDACDACPLDAENDVDGDLVCGDVDNCPGVANPMQEDGDADGLGDACDDCLDVDGDLVCAPDDNCPDIANPGQEDYDNNGQGDACDPCADADVDGVCDVNDNCAGIFNPMQDDVDGDGVGDVCDDCVDADTDGDGACNKQDNCPGVANAGQEDADKDGMGDACDACPNDPDNDIDGDLVCGDVDNCPDVDNFSQADEDGDGVGDACEPPPPDTSVSEEGSCGCRVAGHDEGSAALFPLLSLALAAIARRRGAQKRR